MSSDMLEIQAVCIRQAEKLLNGSAAPTAESVKAARMLMDIALDVAELILRQEFQTRYGVAVFRDRSSSRTTKENKEVKRNA